MANEEQLAILRQGAEVDALSVFTPNRRTSSR